MHKKTNEWAKWTSDFSDAFHQVNKNHSSTFHGILFLFHIYSGFLTDKHILKIGGKWLWKHIVRPVRDINNSTP